MGKPATHPRWSVFLLDLQKCEVSINKLVFLIEKTDEGGDEERLNYSPRIRKDPSFKP